MKKIFTLFAAVFFAASINAQTSYVFDEATGTAGGSAKSTAYKFLCGDQTFTLDNDKSKTYDLGTAIGTNTNKTIKYSAAVWTVTIPTGVSISSITFEGYGNDADTAGSISDINGTDVTSNNFTFNAGKNPANSTKYDYKFTTPVTGTLTFTVKAKQICAYITLTSNASPSKDPTSVKNISAEKSASENANTYNLAGQQVSKTQKGLVIKNGKKIINM